MTAMALQDAAGRRRSSETLPGYHVGRPPRNEGLRYTADPPSVEEIVAVMRQAGTSTQGLRVRALVVILWRAGLRIGEALALTESDLDERRGSVLVRHGKGDKRREVGMDDWGWQQLHPWMQRRLELPVGPLLCVASGPTAGRPWAPSATRAQLRRLAAQAGVRDPVRTASAASRSRRRDGPRGCVAERHVLIRNSRRFVERVSASDGGQLVG
jgi:site-specific recombinase XerD